MVKISALLLTLLLTLGLCAATHTAVTDNTLRTAVTGTAQYVYQEVKSPQVGPVGGEWAIFGLARSGYAVPEGYYQAYYAAVEDHVKAHGGKLDDKKYTEYSRIILALTAIGAEPSNVAGYDLLAPLGDYDRIVSQGINGPIWALIALDSGNYDMPLNTEAKTQATRQMFIDDILDCQLPDGGWSLGGDQSDPDVTGMVLLALSKYQDQDEVKQATEKTLAWLSKTQNAQGGFSSWGTVNSESTAQVLVALCELGIPLDDARFVKNGHTVLDSLLTFRQSNGSFVHHADSSEPSPTATEQGLYALVSAQRTTEGKPSLFRMEDVTIRVSGSGAAVTGLPGKHTDVKAVPIQEPGKTFTDLSDNHRTAVEALAARGIVNGRDGGAFAPDATMIRAEFAAIVTRGLGLTPEPNHDFADVTGGDWFAGYVGTASTYGIINGVGGGRFAPEGTITRQEAAVMVTRAAKLCGMDTQLDDAAVRNTLAQFSDYVTVPDWARQGLAFCYAQGILDDSVLEIEGMESVCRSEIAQMLYALLDSAKLL